MIAAFKFDGRPPADGLETGQPAGNQDDAAAKYAGCAEGNGHRDALVDYRHSGAMRQHRTRNLEILGLVLTPHPGLAVLSVIVPAPLTVICVKLPS